MLLAHKSVIMYFCRIGVHVPVSHPFFADLYQSEYFTGGSIMQRAAWAILFLDQREREVFIIPSLERIQGAEFDGWDPTPSPKSLLRLQEHIHCVSSGVWKVNKIVWKPDIIQNLGGRESNIRLFFFFFNQVMTCVPDHDGKCAHCLFTGSRWCFFWSY